MSYKDLAGFTRVPHRTGVVITTDPDAPVRVDARNSATYQLLWKAFDTARRAYNYTGSHLMAMSMAEAGLALRLCKLVDDRKAWGSHFTTPPDRLCAHWDQANADASDYSNRYLAIKNTILGCAREIFLLTNGFVTQDKLRIVVNPITAVKMAKTGEMHAYMSAGLREIERLQGRVDENEIWGMPDNLYGLKLIIEDTPMIDTSFNRRWAFPDNTAAILCVCPPSAYGQPSFDTLKVMHYGHLFFVNDSLREDLVTHTGYVCTDTYDCLANKMSGYLIGHLFSESSK